MTFGDFCKKHELTNEEINAALAYWIALRILPFAELMYWSTHQQLFPREKQKK